MHCSFVYLFFFFQAEDGIRDLTVTGVQTCALPILMAKGAVPDDHPLLLGMTGFWGLEVANGYAREADVVLALGTRFAERSEERRVGKSVDLGGRRIIKKKK